MKGTIMNTNYTLYRITEGRWTALKSSEDLLALTEEAKRLRDETDRSMNEFVVSEFDVDEFGYLIDD